MQKGQYRIIITRHATEQVYRRRIHENIIENTIQQGKMEYFGKNNVKFIKEFRRGTICCMDEIINDTIVIVTITKTVKK